MVARLVIVTYLSTCFWSLVFLFFFSLPPASVVVMIFTVYRVLFTGIYYKTHQLRCCRLCSFSMFHIRGAILEFGIRSMEQLLNKQQFSTVWTRADIMRSLVFPFQSNVQALLRIWFYIVYFVLY